MPLLTFRQPPLAHLFIALTWIGFVQAHAAPVTQRGGAMTPPAGPVQNDTAQDREHRAGVQAQLRGDLASARRRFEAALKLSPDHVPALLGMADLAQRQKQREQTEKWLGQAERVAPGSALVQLARGRFHMAGHDLARAESAFLAARAAAPMAIAPLVELGDLHLQQPGRAPEALKDYRAAQALDKSNATVSYGLGVALLANGQRSEATVALNRAAELAPRDPAPARALGRMYLEAGEPGQAVAAFDAGLKRQPNWIPLLLDRTDALARQGRWDDAIKQVKRVLELQPRVAEVQFKAADVYQGASLWPQARASYLKSIELDPGNPLSYNNLAWMTVTRGDDAASAVSWASKAVELSPESSPFHDTLGWAHRAAGRLDLAQASLYRAIELEPRIAGYHYHLGIVQTELNQLGKARAALARALEIDTKFAQADDARRRLQALPVAPQDAFHPR